MPTCVTEAITICTAESEHTDCGTSKNGYEYRKCIFPDGHRCSANALSAGTCEVHTLADVKTTDFEHETAQFCVIYRGTPASDDIHGICAFATGETCENSVVYEHGKCI